MRVISIIIIIIHFMLLFLCDLSYLISCHLTYHIAIYFTIFSIADDHEEEDEKGDKGNDPKLWFTLHTLTF